MSPKSLCAFLFSLCTLTLLAPVSLCLAAEFSGNATLARQADAAFLLAPALLLIVGVLLRGDWLSATQCLLALLVVALVSLTANFLLGLLIGSAVFGYFTFLPRRKRRLINKATSRGDSLPLAEGAASSPALALELDLARRPVTIALTGTLLPQTLTMSHPQPQMSSASAFASDRATSSSANPKTSSAAAAPSLLSTGTRWLLGTLSGWFMGYLLDRLFV